VYGHRWREKELHDDLKFIFLSEACISWSLCLSLSNLLIASEFCCLGSCIVHFLYSSFVSMFAKIIGWEDNSHVVLAWQVFLHYNNLFTVEVEA